MYHDPYSGQQLKAFRSDPTGRWSPIVEEEIKDDADLFLIICGTLSGIGFALLIFWGV